MGYVGSVLIPFLRRKHPNSIMLGYDIGYYAHILSKKDFLPETMLDIQYIGDVRNFDSKLLKDVNSVIYLAAISNDPMGKEFEKVTYDVNYNSAIEIAKEAKKNGVNSFVFASSCSVYGLAEDGMRTENSELNPLTAYSKSKVYAEKDLEHLASKNFIITCLRFATACGYSPRLRLDLVLNDFVASAFSNRKIEILSDGRPWRPLIHVQDMSRAIDWAIHRKSGENYIVLNTGSNEWNFQVKDLAEAVHEVVKDTKININKNAQPDKRSYKVDFGYFNSIAKKYSPKINLNNAVIDLYEGIIDNNLKNKDFRDSNLMRLNVLNSHKAMGRLNNNLEWTR